MHVESDRTYRFSRSPDEVWEAIGRVDAYQRWWPWLHSFEADGLVSGDRWRCTIRPPVPYSLRFTVTIADAEEPTRIEAEVSGDLEGAARVELSPDGDGCVVHLRSSLTPVRQPLKSVAAVAPWLARYGHDWVLDVGSRQFRQRALRPSR